MTDDVIASRATPTPFARSLFHGLPARYDALAYVLSFGQDARWRRTMVDHSGVEGAALVLDVATGPGSVVRALTTASPRVRVVGLDVSADMLARGRSNAEAAGLAERTGFVLGRGESLPFAEGTFDAVTFTYLLRYVTDPAHTVREIARVVRPGGHIASLEFARPENGAVRALWWFYTRAVLPVAGFVLGGPSWWHVGRFLGPSISAHGRTYGDEWMRSAWAEAGIVDVETKRMSLGGGLVMWGRRSP